jgi:NADH:ubiquinone oxidoreductase subunit K
MTPSAIGLVAVLALLALGLYGLLVIRNLIKLVIVLQILAKAGTLAIIVAGSAAGQINLGQSLAVTVIVVDTIVAVVCLALAVQVHRRWGTLDVKRLSALKR